MEREREPENGDSIAQFHALQEYTNTIFGTKKISTRVKSPHHISVGGIYMYLRVECTCELVFVSTLCGTMT